MKLIVGLGNPGKQYEQTLHNAGALVLDSFDLSWEKAPQNIPSLIAKQGETLYAKPTTFMNKSGIAVQKLLTYYKLTTHELTIVYDDIDLMLGDIRVSHGTGAGGHNGIRSIIESLGGDKTFQRIRIGIATPRTAQKAGRHRDVAKIVLKKPGFFNRVDFQNAIRSGADEVLRAIQ